MGIDELLQIIHRNLPPETAIQNDRLGLQIQGGIEKVSKILITLELNDEVIEESISCGCDTIITFHPLIFKPLTSIINSDRTGSLCLKIIKSDLSLISIHTNFDSFAQGTSSIFAEKLGLNSIGFLVPDPNLTGFGMGVIALPDQALTEGDLLDRVAQLCHSPVKYTNGKAGSPIEKIAIVGGSGSGFYDQAEASGADAFITADITYHTFHRAAGKMMLVDPGHYEMEQFVPFGLRKFLIDRLDKDSYESIRISATLTNPVKYYPNGAIYTENQRKYLLHTIDEMDKVQ